MFEVLHALFSVIMINKQGKKKTFDIKYWKKIRIAKGFCQMAC